MTAELRPASVQSPIGATNKRCAVDQLFEPIDNSSLTVFRLAFGTAVAFYAWETLTTPKLAADYILPKFHLTYFCWEWVRPWPGDGMYLHFLAMFFAAVGIALGLFYRLSAFVLLLTFTHVFLIERTLYNNHYYLVILLAFLANVIPLHRGWSLDSARKPWQYSPTLPQWMLWLVRFQIGIVYFYGGLAKLNSDWLRGQPMGMWLAAKSDLPIIGSWLTLPPMGMLFSIGGLLIDLAAVPLLMWRRTRLAMFAVLVAFHLLNSMLFNIGFFPWLMIIATTVFYPPDWPRRLFQIPNHFHRRSTPDSDRSPHRKSVVAFLAIYSAVQLLVPLRHHLYPGDPSWTEYGQLFSWRMMLRQKLTGVRFYGTNPDTGQHGVIDITSYLTQRQAGQMSRDPDLLVHFSRMLANDFRQKGLPNMQIRVKVLASLNGRKPQLLVDPTVDPAQEHRRIGSQPWVVPLTEPFRDLAWSEPIEQWEKQIDSPSAISDSSLETDTFSTGVAPDSL